MYLQTNQNVKGHIAEKITLKSHIAKNNFKRIFSNNIIQILCGFPLHVVYRILSMVQIEDQIEKQHANI